MKPFTMIRTQHLVAVAALALLASCVSNSWGHRPQSADPDKRLAELMERYEECETKHCQGDNTPHILVDADRWRNEIERQSLEFPRHVPTLMACAALAFEHDELQKTQSFCDRILAIEPVHADASVLRSQVAIREGNLPFAKRLLESQRDYAPDNAGVRESLSATLYLLKDLDGATRELAAAEKLGAPKWRTSFNRGLIAEARGDAKGAMAAYEASVAENPDFAPARSRLAGKKAEGGVQ